MTRIPKKNIVKGIDKAFELFLVLITIISGVIAEFITSEQKIELPPIIANMRRLIIIFVFPLIITILSWIIIYFIDDETKKMHLRTYAWSSSILLTFLEVTELYIICLPQDYPQEIVFPLIIPLLFCLFFPIIPLLLLRKILNRYRIVLLDVPFFAEKGKLATLRRYGAFLCSYIVFWSFFALTLLV